MMKIFEVEQGSQKWHDMRAKYPRTASRTPVVMGVSPFANSEKLAKEIKFGIKPFYSNAMKQGNELEDMVREKACVLLDDTFIPQVGVKDNLLASLDGINFTGDTIIEIKCSEHTYNEVKNGTVPKHYYWQIIHQLFVFGAKKAYLVAYNPKSEDIAISEPISYEDKSKEIISAWEEFEKFMENYELPEEIEREDTEWELVASRLREINEEKKLLLEEEKEYKETLIALANGVKTKGFGVSVYQTSRKNVDYKKAITENSIDVSQYEKECVSWSVRVS